METEIRIRKLNREDCRSVFTLNTWTEDKKQEVRDYLEEGYWVHLGSSCIGHTLAHMVERDGIKWVEEEFAGILRAARSSEYGDIYLQLI